MTIAHIWGTCFLFPDCVRSYLKFTKKHAKVGCEHHAAFKTAIKERRIMKKLVAGLFATARTKELCSYVSKMIK